MAKKMVCAADSISSAPVPEPVPAPNLFWERAFVLLAAFGGGAGVMVLEMAGNRVLAPWFGNSLYTWTGLIGVVLLAMSCGYYAGGYLADKFSGWILLANLLAAAAVSVLFIPLAQGALDRALNPTDIVWGPILASIGLFAVPGVIMGAVTPVAIRLRSVMGCDRHVGLSAGQIGMVGTLGSVVGTFAGGFFLIPLLHLDTLFLLIAGTLGGIACLGYALFARTTWRIKAPIALLTVLLSLGGNVVGGATLKPYALIHEENSFYHRIRVFENKNMSGDTIRTLHLDSTVEGAQAVGKDDLPVEYQKYWELLRIFAPNPKTVAFIGGGAFGMPEAVATAFPAADVHVYELDPKVIAVGKRFFRLGDYPTITAVAGDARLELRKSGLTFDMIFGDAYNGIRAVPAHLVTREFFGLVRERMSEGGVFMMNIISAVEGGNAAFYQAAGSTLASVFKNVYVFPVHPEAPRSAQNIILVGVDRDVDVDSALRTAPIDRATRDKFTRSFRGLFEPASREPLILTDQKNPVEFIVARAQLYDHEKN